MSERFKYAKNGICRVENFAEHLAAGTFPTIELGRSCSMNWYSALRICVEGSKIYPVIWCDNDDSEVEHRVQVYYNLPNNSEKNTENYEITHRAVLPFDKAFEGFYAPILEVLDLKNGWLDIDGALSYEYGIQVKAVMKDKIWRFNFDDKLFNASGEMVEFVNKYEPATVEPFYTHRMLLKFHSKKLAKIGKWAEVKDISEEQRKQFIDLLQILHGVRVQLTPIHGQIQHDACTQKMFNVTSYCDWYFVHTLTWESLEGKQRGWLSFSNKHNLRHFLALLMRSVTSLKEYVDEGDIEKMSNETMKLFMAKFLYEKF